MRSNVMGLLLRYAELLFSGVCLLASRDDDHASSKPVFKVRLMDRVV